MSKQSTLTNFLKVGSKRTPEALSSASKRGKLDGFFACDGVGKENVNCDNDSNKSNTVSSSLTPGKNSAAEKRKELITLVEKYPIISKSIGLTWYSALSSEFRKPYFSDLNKFVVSKRASGIVYPPHEQVWTWTQACRIDEVKVVILGQDPYHNPGQAHGLCFSVQIGVPPPPSLINMYKELESDIEGFKRRDHGYLIGWARQGVLLLNACLTVTKNSPNSHKDAGWENLTTAVIKHLNDKYDNIVFLLWGSYAQKKADFVDKKRHCILKAVHPSPLSAARGFFGCKHFSKCNEYLASVGKTPIDWNDLPTE